MSFTICRQTKFYSSKSKSAVWQEIENLVAEKNSAKAAAETVTGRFVIRTTNRLLHFHIVYCGNIYEFDGKRSLLHLPKGGYLWAFIICNWGNWHIHSLCYCRR